MFIKRESHAGLMKGLANKIPPLRGNMVIHFAKDHDEFAGNVPCAGEGVVVFALSERVAVHVGCEVADCGGDAGVEGAAVGEVASEAHACCWWLGWLVWGFSLSFFGGEGKEKKYQWLQFFHCRWVG